MMVIMVSVKHTIVYMFDYIKYSNFSIMFNINPRYWKIGFSYDKPDAWNPKMHVFILRLLMLKLVLTIDDGSY